MNIVVLDGHALNPGDLSWDALERLGTLTIHERSAPEEVVQRAMDAQIVLTNKALLLEEQLHQLPNLRFISVMATGYNVVDIKTAKMLGILVSNVTGYSTDSVAQHAMALLLELSNQVGIHGQSVSKGCWSTSADWSYWERPLIELTGKKLGIIGYGNIGKRMGEIATAFGMQIIVSHPRLQHSTDQYQLVTTDELFTTSDYVSLHVPLTPETKEIINRERLQQMKSNACLINTSRGPLINENDLRWALDNNEIAGAGLDVLCDEPPKADNPLIGAPNCIITPHQAWASYESRSRLMEESAKNVEAFIKGNPRNLVL